MCNLPAVDSRLHESVAHISCTGSFAKLMQWMSVEFLPGLLKAKYPVPHYVVRSRHGATIPINDRVW